MNNPIPYKVSEANMKFYKVTQLVYFIGLIGHLFALFLFAMMGISEMIIFNVVISIPSFILALILNRTGKHSLAFGIAFIELLFHQLLGAYYTGWGFGFQFWFIYLAALSFFNAVWKTTVKLFLLGLVFLSFILLYIYAQKGYYILPENLMAISYLLNLLWIAGLIPLLINYFAKSALLLEQKLITEKQITEDQHVQLTEQHESLVLEQDKTHKMLNKIESLFGQQVSEEVAKEMIESENEIDSKIMNVTVMFLDIRDFTVFADSRKPEEVARFQNIVFSALIDIVKIHNGIVSQILGDGIMAVFGAPVTNPDHTISAVKAGFMMLDKIIQLSKEGQIPHINIGIGLNSGNVMVGNVGNETRKFYSLTGTNVIIASRIEQLNKKFNSRFLISENVYKHIKSENYEIEDLGKIQLKGIEKNISVYKLF